jgi:hypothetical protein
VPHPHPSDLVIMKHKVDIPRPLPISPHKLFIARRPLLLRVARKHRLQTNADRLDIVDGRPARSIEEIEADDAVGVDVWVPGDGVGLGADEHYFGGLRSKSQLRFGGDGGRRGGGEWGGELTSIG